MLAAIKLQAFGVSSKLRKTYPCAQFVDSDLPLLAESELAFVDSYSQLSDADAG